jgi:hypothetical protein
MTCYDDRNSDSGCPSGQTCCTNEEGFSKCVTGNYCAGGGKLPTNKRVQLGGNTRIVYQGKRGGEYIKMSGGFVSLAEAKKKAAKKDAKKKK